MPSSRSFPSGHTAAIAFVVSGYEMGEGVQCTYEGPF